MNILVVPDTIQENMGGKSGLINNLLLLTEKQSLFSLDHFLKSSAPPSSNPRRIYVALHDTLIDQLSSNTISSPRQNTNFSFFDLIGRFYRSASTCGYSDSTNKEIDFRLIIENFRPLEKTCSILRAKLPTLDHIYLDRSSIEDLKLVFDESKSFDRDLDAFHRDILACPHKLRYIDFSNMNYSNGQVKFADSHNFDDFVIGMHSGVVLGGTFDRIHNGHKFLLSIAALLAKNKLICGVTDGPMLEHKLLYELIEPVSRRIQLVKEFLYDIDASLDFQAVPIYDPFGPSTVDQNLQCIVVSSETVRGAAKVNEERLKKGLNELHTHVIDLINEDIKNVIDERKVSSSKIRVKLLGKLIRPSAARTSKFGSGAFLIGLTGGVCSGKTHIAAYLSEFGAYVVDCDKLGHEAYAVGTDAYKKIIAEFGAEIVDSQNNNAINRKILGAKVFSDKDNLAKLNSIVWPAIRRLALERINDAKNRGYKIIVLDAAVLFEAGWQDMVHEIWTCVVPIAEVITRMKNRNGLSEDEALKRINAQISNKDRVDRSHIVFCSLWDYSVTKAQVKKAWDDVNDYLSFEPMAKSKV